MHHAPKEPLADVSYSVWRLRDPAGDALRDADVLIHCAFVAYDKAEASAVNVEGSARLLAEGRQHGVRSAVFLSSMSARRDAANQYGRDKAAIAATFDGPGDLVIRAGLVLGHGGLFHRIRGFIATRRVVPLVGGGGQLIQTVFVEDLTAAIAAGLRLGLSGTLTVAEPEPVHFRELLAETARQMGVRVLFVPVPLRVVEWALRVAALFRLRLPVSADNLLGLGGARPADVREDLRRLGVSVRNYRESLHTLLSRD